MGCCFADTVIINMSVSICDSNCISKEQKWSNMETCVKLNAMDGTTLALWATLWSLGPKFGLHIVAEQSQKMILIYHKAPPPISLIWGLNSVTLSWQLLHILHISHISHMPVLARNGAKDNSLMFSIYHHEQSVCVQDQLIITSIPFYNCSFLTLSITWKNLLWFSIIT